MSYAPAFPAFVDDAGHFALKDLAQFRQSMQRFRGNDVVLTVKKKQKPRSLPQLRWFRGVVIADIARATGVIDPAEFQGVYEGLMFRFARLPDGPFGQPRRKSLGLGENGMTSEERTQLINDIVIWAETEIVDCTIRRPDDVDLEQVIDPGWS